MNKQELELQLIDDIASFHDDAYGFVMYAFPWGEGPLKNYTGPRTWQKEILLEISQHIQDGKSFDEVLREAVASGHGIGKSALVSWIILWGISTREDTRIIITANTESQLVSKTWPEVGKWYSLMINKSWFKYTATALFSLEKEHEKNWRADIAPWSENNTEAFAGAHNEGKRLILIFDEASAIHDKVWEVTEGALTDANTEIMWFVFGNPTRNTGRFRECFRKFKHRWNNRQIDSRTVEGTNKNQLQQWCDDYGIDSDFVKVRVRGIFPMASAKQFISEEDVDAAYGRPLRKEQFEFAPIIIGCDPAWEGDDVLTIGLRQGLFSKKLRSIPKNDNDMEIANLLASLEDEYQADAVFIDMGYGTGIYSGGKTMGRNWQLVNAASTRSVIDQGCLNKRAEMWKSIRDWLKEGGSIPTDPKLREQLLAPETVPRADGKLQIEPKPMIKKRLGESTDEADWLGLTFAYPVARKGIGFSSSNTIKSEYDPYSEERL